jgi:hypothetical protein
MRLTVLLLIAAASCARSEDASLLGAPRRDDFSAVSSVLERRCGGLDCHGAPARSLRVFGSYGLRLDGRDVPGGVDTTEAEVDATYESVVTLDPEVLSRVVASGGHGAERWLVLSKARQREAHVGGARLIAGTPGDECVRSWASGTLDIEACASDDFAPQPKPGDAWE